MKPGENSNRGCGIEVADTLSEIKSLINANAQSNGNRTSIVQLYIDKPLLISGRKFDVRAYAMLTSTNGLLKDLCTEIVILEPVQNHLIWEI